MKTKHQRRQLIRVIRDTEPEIVDAFEQPTRRIDRGTLTMLRALCAIAVVVILVVLGCGCSVRSFNRATLVSATAAIGCDYGQTRRGLEQGIPEMNPMIGAHPSAVRLAGYQVAAVAATAGAYYATGRLFGERWKWLVPLIVTEVELAVVSRNAIVLDGGAVCGL